MEDSMLKVLIVDDEWIIRDGLKSFHWENFNCRLVGEAEDGDEGFLLAKVLTPDIILTDIRMPGMDGLTFTRKVKELNPDVEVLLLTGYDSFDFAQTAIREGVYDYLLKPTSFRELERIIVQLCEKINQAKANNKKYTDMMLKYEKAMPMLTSKLAYDLINGRIYDKKDIEKKLELFNIRIEKYVIVTAKLDYEEDSKKEEKVEPWILEFGICNICEEILKKYCENLLTDNSASSFSFIMIFPKKSSDTDCINISTQACIKAQKAVKEYSKKSICFGISNVETDACQINRFYRQALEACRQKFFFGGDCIIQYKDINSNNENCWTILNGEKENIFNAISSGNTSCISQQMKQLTCEITNSLCDMDSVKSAMLELLVGGLRVFEEMHSDNIKSYLAMIHKGIESIYSCETVDKLVASVEEILLSLAVENNRASMDYHQKTVDNIIQYIYKNYKDDLSLDLISDIFHLSSAYISRLIKRHTGKTFLEILLDIRLDIARELITTKDYKVFEIAKLVGYNDPSYFIQVFKKKYGVTPNEYKNLI